MYKERPQHTPSQTDTVVRFVQEHVAVFLRLRNLGSYERHKGATRNGVPQSLGLFTFTLSCDTIWLAKTTR